MKRIFWGMVGLGAGVVIGVRVTNWVGRTRDALTPSSLGARALDLAEEWRVMLAKAMEEGKAAMAQREAELRAQSAGTAR